MKTIQQFIDGEGGITQAAAKLGLNFFTVYRWVRKTKPTKPSHMAVEKLKKLGVQL